ncbi:uncharacterized protein DUF4345 [Sphingomonas sp. PP-CE-1A-559]|uniref:DUF4345 domain-containing protein n=1 Tax=unclassified Sphingomonas TaxID=196159 RepID=UPI000E72D073|nr:MULTISPECIES: DUF4345 domain-containing protein [unclassified Sphingomonas]RKE44572.1 uncharacterized protein DUF4345 [Sphingomonas sp. PP-CC-1A-547]TCM06360.1 uncharacterized protein DUF4345 [Sphingomonas sp. PP-CC-3G-468]TCP88680.1 uncharacterized protein DUF4345 [Sphingomonas sp. PP-CE-1A-559]
MTSSIEKRLLQAVIAVACLLPLIVGGQGVLHGPAPFGHLADVPRDLDSHFRYISGIFFATGLGFVSCIPNIERKGPRFRLLGGLIFVGGVSRLISLIAVGVPSQGHVLGLGMETIVVPLLMLWQWNFARRNFARRTALRA